MKSLQLIIGVSVALLGLPNGFSQSPVADGASKAFFKTAASNSRILVGKNIAIKATPTDLPIVEPHISAHPRNANHLLAAAMVVTNRENPFETSRLATFLSLDGGATWTQKDFDYWGYDVWTAILPNGKALLSWLGKEKKFDGQMPIQIFTSNDGGKIWDPAVATLAGDYDGTKMTVDRRNGTVYFTATKMSQDADGNMKTYVYFNKNLNDAGFNSPVSIDQKGAMIGIAQPVVLSDGTLLIPVVGRAAHEDFRQAKSWVHLSHDGGKTFSEPIMISSHSGNHKGYTSLVADTGQSRFKDRIYFVRATGYGNEFKGIWLNYSQDKGKTWSKEIQVDQFASSSAGHAFIPSLAVNQNGVVAVSWVDRRADPERKKNDIYFTVSLDGGNTFHPPVRVTDVSANPVTPKNSNTATQLPGGGHYNGLTAKADGSFQLIWSDSRSGIYQLYTCNVRLNKF
jgi:Neuraminidase (sialidase)